VVNTSFMAIVEFSMFFEFYGLKQISDEVFYHSLPKQVKQTKPIHFGQNLIPHALLLFVYRDGSCGNLVFPPTKIHGGMATIYTLSILLHLKNKLSWGFITHPSGGFSNSLLTIIVFKHLIHWSED